MVENMMETAIQCIEEGFIEVSLNTVIFWEGWMHWCLAKHIQNITREESRKVMLIACKQAFKNRFRYLIILHSEEGIFLIYTNNQHLLDAYRHKDNIEIYVNKNGEWILKKHGKTLIGEDL